MYIKQPHIFSLLHAHNSGFVLRLYVLKMVRYGAQLIRRCGCTLLKPKQITMRPSTAVRAATAGDHCSFIWNKKTTMTCTRRTRMFCSTSSSASSRNRSTTAELHEFKDRLRPLGPGRVGLSLDHDSGLATLVLDNHERRNGENL